MSLPHIFGPIAGGTQIPLSFLDDNFNAIGLLSIVPNTATGTNAISLTPQANTPVISAYANYQQFSFVAPNTSTGAVTAGYLALGQLPVYLANGTTQAGAGDIVAGVFYTIAFNQALNAGGGGFQIVGPIVSLVAGYPALTQTFTGDHTILAAERSQELRMNSAGAHVFTLTSGAAYGNGFNVEIANINSGNVQIVANGTDRILSKGIQLPSINLPSLGDGGRLVGNGASPTIWTWKGKRSIVLPDFAATVSNDTALPHTLGVFPDDVRVLIVNTIANLNYSPGDIVQLGLPQINAGGGFIVAPDNTNVNFKTANAALGIPNKTTFVVTAITTADWNYRVKVTVID